MTRYTYNFRYDQQGVIDYGHYRSRARTARNETRVRVFRRIVALMLGKRAPLPAKTRIACVSY